MRIVAHIYDITHGGKMGKRVKIFSLIFVLIFVVSSLGSVYAAIWEFGTSGTGVNHFTPRGFLVDTDNGQHWLSSGYNNSGEDIYYSGTKNGVDYLDAKKNDGSNYVFYAMTHRNNEPGRRYLAVYKDGVRIELGSYTEASFRGDKVDPSGNGTCYVIPIKNYELEPGCQYEFCFLQGMMANNGITMVLAPGTSSGKYLGYIQLADGSYTADEKKIYDDNKDSEYKFVESYTKDSSGEYTVNLIPMRFSVQTYADLSEWEKAADKAQKFIDSVKESDYTSGKYVRSNVKNLISVLSKLNDKAENTVKKQLKATANSNIKAMIDELNAALNKAINEKPQKADISKLTAKLKEAEILYNKARDNTGTDMGQYGVLEVEDLKYEIDNAKGMDDYTPQTDIDNQVIFLQNAMDAVYDSLVEKEQRVFYDKVTGIYVIAPADSISDNATMVVTRVGKTENEYADMKSKLPKSKKEAELYDIRFYENEKRVYLSENAEVQIPIIDSISSRTSTVYSFSNNKLTKIKSVKSNGIQILKSDLKSALVMAGAQVTAKDKKKENQNKDKTVRVMGAENSSDGDRSDNVLSTAKKKKEVFKDPVNKLLNRNANLASFSNDVKQKSNPVYLIFFAAILAVTAVVLGLSALMKGRHERKV